MNTPRKPNDPILQSLADEASDLPLRAAHEARSRNMHHLRQRRLAASVVTILFAGLCAWSLITMPEPRSSSVTMQTAVSHENPKESATPFPSPAIAKNDPSVPPPRDFVKVQTQDEAMNDPLPLPDGLDWEQQELFKAARGLPLLLVRDGSGKVARIHVIER
jgi:hypothetical protein